MNYTIQEIKRIKLFLNNFLKAFGKTLALTGCVKCISKSKLTTVHPI